MKPYKERLYHFLGGYWYMDTESTDAGLSDVYREMSVSEIERAARDIETFLQSNETENEKTKFVEDCTDMYYPNMKPLDWLRLVHSRLVEYLRSMK